MFAAVPAAQAYPLYGVDRGEVMLTAATQQAEATQQVDAAVQVDATPAPTADLQVATVVASHLPSWVQVVVASASLYITDGGSDLAGPRLSRHVFLRVLSGGASRLQVQAYDDNGTPGLIGWIDPNQVLPSAPGTDWLVASNATRLYSNPDASADVLRNLDRFTPLQKTGDTVQGRVQVRVYRPDFSAVVVEQGWVSTSDIGPALAPSVRVAGPTDRSILRTATNGNPQRAFLDATGGAARAAMAQTGVPASVTVAQAILESDWGRSSLAQTANNYFGMKAIGSMGTDGVVYLPTSEYDADGELYQTVSAFRAYRSLADSLADHDRLLQTSSRYAQAMKATSDPRQFATLLMQAGYSTDPAYADKLVSLMDRYNLYSLDQA